MSPKSPQHGRVSDSDPWQEPGAKTWVRHVLSDMAPKMEHSAMVMSLIPGNREGDVKFWVELGAAIMMDKPIIAIVLDDQPLSGKLAAVADEVVRLPRGVPPEASEHLIAAVGRIREKLDREGEGDVPTRDANGRKAGPGPGSRGGSS